MKATRISEHIWSLKIWLLIPIHVWIIVDKDGVTLIDAGISTMAKPIMNFIRKLDAGPLQSILLTHGHSDHTGSINKLLSKTKVPVYAHQKEIPYMAGNLPYPRRKKAVKTVAKDVVQPLGTNTDGSLKQIAGLTPYLTPGHSPGHVAYYHELDQVLLAGDLFTSKKGKLRKPMTMFTADMDQAIKSSVIIEHLKPKKLEVCHGSTVHDPASQMKAYLDS